MNGKFEELKNQLLESWKNLENRLLESNSFNHLKEKYQSLNIVQQKLIKYLVVFFIFISLAYLPLSYFFSSVFNWAEFKEKQKLSLELLKMRNKIHSSSLRYSQSQLKNRIERITEKYSNQDFKIKDKRSVFSKRESIYQIDFDVQLEHLNIKQAIQLGTELHTLSQVRLNSITLDENKEFPKHYDVEYKLSGFVPKKKSEPLTSKRKRVPRKKKSTPLKKKTPKVKKELKGEDIENKTIHRIKDRKTKKIKKQPSNKNLKDRKLPKLEPALKKGKD